MPCATDVLSRSSPPRAGAIAPSLPVPAEEAPAESSSRLPDSLAGGAACLSAGSDSPDSAAHSLCTFQSVLAGGGEKNGLKDAGEKQQEQREPLREPLTVGMVRGRQVRRGAAVDDGVGGQVGKLSQGTHQPSGICKTKGTVGHQQAELGEPQRWADPSKSKTGVCVSRSAAEQMREINADPSPCVLPAAPPFSLAPVSRL